MRQLTALIVCTGCFVTAGASLSEACWFGCFRPQTCGYAGGCSTYYGGGYTSNYSPYTSLYSPYTSYYSPVTTYYAPTTNCCPTTACYSCPTGTCGTNACCPTTAGYSCPTGTCGTGGCCPTTACYAPSCCPTNCCAACPGGTCTGAGCCPAGSSSSATDSVSAPRASAPAKRAAGLQPLQKPSQFVSAPAVDSNWQPQPKVRTANLQRTIPAPVSTGWEPVR